MDNELKTLKDLGYTGDKDCACFGCSEGCECDIKIIKAEAVKWVKTLRFQLGPDSPKERIKDNEAKIEILKIFFNLTEEDLK